MADFGRFRITNGGIDLEYKAQASGTMNFTKFVLGDGEYSGAIKELTNVVSPVMNAQITRLNVQTASTNKKVTIGFNINTSSIATGFYLREIGLFAEDPDTHQDVLVFYGNAGETADYISSSSSTTISEKLIDLNVYIDDVENITAIIDSSMVYATTQDLQNLSNTVNTALAEKANNKKTYTTTLDTTWTGSGPYTKTIAINGITDTDIVNMYPIWSNNTTTRATQKEEYAKISMLTSTTNSITLTCDEEKPTTSLDVRLEVYY